MGVCGPQGLSCGGYDLDLLRQLSAQVEIPNNSEMVSKRVKGPKGPHTVESLWIQGLKTVAISKTCFHVGLCLDPPVAGPK